MKDDAQNNQHKHDTVFKLAMREMRVAREMIVRHINPEALKNLDLNTLSICKSSYIDKDLKHSHADILYKAKTVNKGNAYIYFLWEHQSTYDKHMHLRLLKYLVNIMQDHLAAGHKKLPIVLPALVYNGVQKPYPGSCDLFDDFEQPDLARKVMFKPFSLLDLSIQSDEELLEDKWSALPNMILKHMRDRDFANALSQPLAWVVSYCYQHNGKVFVQSMLRSMIEYTSIMESDAFIEQVVQASPEVGDQIVTTYERLINQGKVEGKLEGKLEANANLIKNLIKDGFDDRRIAKLVEVDLSSVRAIRGNMVTT